MLLPHYLEACPIGEYATSDPHGVLLGLSEAWGRIADSTVSELASPWLRLVSVKEEIVMQASVIGSERSYAPSWSLHG